MNGEAIVACIIIFLVWIVPIIVTSITMYRYRDVDKKKFLLTDSWAWDIVIMLFPIGGIIQSVEFHSNIGWKYSDARHANGVLKCNNCGVFTRRHQCIRDGKSEKCPYCSTLMSSQYERADASYIESSPKLNKVDSFKWHDMVEHDAFNKEQAELIKAARAKKFLESDKDDSGGTKV